MKRFRLQHRHALAAPFVVLALIALVGGVVNSIDARGRVVDDHSDKPVAGTRIVHGSREVTSNEQGEFVFANVPRTSKFEVRPPSGYQIMSVLTTTTEIRLDPLSVTIYAFDETKTREEAPVSNPQVRDTANTKIIANGSASGQIIVAPHPGRDAKVLICGEGFEPKEITVEGVLMLVGLKAGGTGCPSLATATPAPQPTGSPAASPTATPTPSPTGAP